MVPRVLHDAVKPQRRCLTFGRLLRSIVSNLDLSSQLNDAVGRDLEVLHDASSVSDHRRKQSFAPHRHAGSRPRYHRLPAQEERGFEHVELEIVDVASLERLRNVRGVLEAEEGIYSIAVVAERLYRHSFLHWHPRNVLDHDGHENRPLVHDLVVGEVMEKSMRYGVRFGDQKNRSAVDAMRLVLKQRFQKRL